MCIEFISEARWPTALQCTYMYINNPVLKKPVHTVRELLNRNHMVFKIVHCVHHVHAI